MVSKSVGRESSELSVRGEEAAGSAGDGQDFGGDGRAGEVLARYKAVEGGKGVVGVSPPHVIAPLR